MVAEWFKRTAGRRPAPRIVPVPAKPLPAPAKRA
jgi:hypothetical protein